MQISHNGENFSYNEDKVFNALQDWGNEILWCVLDGCKMFLKKYHVKIYEFTSGNFLENFHIFYLKLYI